MDRVTTDGKRLYFRGDIVAEEGEIVADSTEKSKRGFRVEGYSPHRIDYLLLSGDGKVIGVESKTLDDLISSWISKRLQRQLATLQAAVELPVLMLRIKSHSYMGGLDDWPGVRADLLRWQGSGGLIAFAHSRSPKRDLEVLRTIAGQGLTNREQQTIVVGSSRESVLQTIPGVGAKTAEKLADHSLPDLLNMSDKQLREIGAGKRVRDGLERLRI